MPICPNNAQNAVARISSESLSRAKSTQSHMLDLKYTLQVSSDG